MNDTKTLKQICELLNVSRRVIQRYEEKGLIHTDLKDKYGHLLYDEKTVYRMMYIRLYQLLEFKLNEITNFIDKPEIEVKEILTDRINKLRLNLDAQRNNLILIERFINDSDLTKIKSIIKEVV